MTPSRIWPSESVHQRRLPHLLALGFEQRPPRQNDVAAPLVELDDLEARLLAEKGFEIADGSQVDLRPWQECLDPDVDREPALDASDDRSFDRFFVVVGVADLVPNLEAFCFLLRQDQLALFVLDLLDQDLYVVTDGDRDLAFFGHELPGSDHAFGFEANIDLDEIIVDREDLAAGDLAFLEGSLIRSEEIGKALAASGLFGSFRTC